MLIKSFCRRKQLLKLMVSLISTSLNRTGISSRRLSGSAWTAVSVCMHIEHLSYDLGQLWVVSRGGLILQCRHWCAGCPWFLNTMEKKNELCQSKGSGFNLIGVWKIIGALLYCDCLLNDYWIVIKKNIKTHFLWLFLDGFNNLAAVFIH